MFMSIMDRLLATFDTFSEKTAVYNSGETITYGELGKRARAIAGYFQQKGIDRECIAIEIDAGIDHIVAMIGIVLSGNYYLSVTEENAYYIGEDFPVSIKFSLLSKGSKKRTSAGVPDICIDEIEVPDNYVPIDFRCLELQRFCMFITSGTSGVSKIIAHNYKTINSDTLRQIAENNIAENDVIDLVFSLSFSASLACIFPALVSGAQLCIFSLRKEGVGALASFWEERGVTVSNVSVSAFLAVCKVNESLKQLQLMRFLSLSAEPINSGTIELFCAKFPESTLLQLAYASTETRTIAKVHLKDRAEISAYNGAAGVAVGNKLISIVADDGRQMSANEIGEIVVESEYIAGEYVGNSAAKKDAFSVNGAMVTYRSGDLGYLNDAGELFLKGRKTNEIKVNGVKVDLGLVEQELAIMPGITRVAVVVNNTQSGTNAIVAFIQTSDQQLNPRAINEFLKNRLPVGHYPNFYSVLEHFPQTHSGKVDRKSLEIASFTNLATASLNDQLPASVLESTIMQVFASVLGVQNIFKSGSFFNDFGGDSLLGLVAIAELEACLNVKLPAHCIWAYETPERIAEFLSTGIGDQKPSCIPANGFVAGRRNLYFLNTFQGGNDYRYIIRKIENQYNIFHLLFDLESVKDSMGAIGLLEELGSLVRKQENSQQAVLLGLSVQGLIAHELAKKVDGVRLCVMLDTYNYYEMNLYSGSRSSLTNWASIMGNSIVSLDPGIMRDFISKKFLGLKSRQIEVSPSSAKPSVHLYHHFISASSKDKTATHACLFIRATRSCPAYLRHGYNWRKYSSGRFKLVNVRSGHIELIEPAQSAVIAEQIIKEVQ